jgi:hypothetical protein
MKKVIECGKYGSGCHLFAKPETARLFHATVRAVLTSVTQLVHSRDALIQLYILFNQNVTAGAYQTCSRQQACYDAQQATGRQEMRDKDNLRGVSGK